MTRRKVQKLFDGGMQNNKVAARSVAITQQRSHTTDKAITLTI